MSILEDYLKTTNKAKTPEEIFEHFDSAIKKMGYDVAGYFLLNPIATDNSKLHKAVLITESAQHLADEYLTQNASQIDASQIWAGKTGKITSWYEQEALDKYPQYEPFLKYLHENDLTSGASIPLYGIGNEMGYLDLAKRRSSGPIDISAPEILTVRLMAYHMHERIRSLIKNETQLPQLSPREREVLQWVMVGKSDSVIADIMMISEHTVGTYIKRCHQKLNVSNRVAAVVKALNLGLISP
ncbi:MAG: LuxR family transcriptional regulator [Micavibrio sp.]|nr:LuxR family transcriptional regulator [Micavibrio sp.]